MSQAEHPWYRIYDELGCAPEPQVPSRTLYEALREVGEIRPDAVALSYMGRKLSFERLLSEIGRCAGALAERGVRAGDTVCICLPNIPQCVIAFYACNLLGAVACMAHPLSTGSEVKRVLRETGARCLLLSEVSYGALAEVLPEEAILCPVGEYLPPHLRCALRLKGGKLPELPRLGALMRGAEPLPPGRRIDPGDCAVLLYSGGTSSGEPKGIELSSDNLNALRVDLLSFVTEARPGDSMLTILPLFHGFGLGVCVHTVLSGGLSSILVPQFSGRSFVRAIKKYRPTFLAGVPTVYEALLASDPKGKLRFPFLKGAFCGGDSVPYELKRRFAQFMAEREREIPLLEGYGLTETVTACTLSPPGPASPNAGVPFPNMELRIVAAGSCEPLPPGEDGEICVAGPQVMLGYHGDAEETARALRVHPDGRTFLHTGDLGHLTEKGELVFRQRLKRVIKVKSFPVYPSEVERVLLSHPGVRACAALGLPDGRTGQRVCAVLVGDAPERELRALCERELNRWSRPSDYIYRESLPKTRVGKINITELLKEITQ